MKGRLIKNAEGELLLLWSDGRIVPSSKGMLQSLLFDFKTIDERSWVSNTYWKTEFVPDMSLYPGETMACITGENQLVIFDPEPFHILVEKNRKLIDPTRYISAKEYGQLHGKSKEIINVYCLQGRIPGAYRSSDGRWKIPEDAPYPVRLRNQRTGEGAGRPKKR